MPEPLVILKPVGRIHVYTSTSVDIFEGASYTRLVAGGQIEVGPDGLEAALLPCPVVGGLVNTVATTAVLVGEVQPPIVAST